MKAIVEEKMRFLSEYKETRFDKKYLNKRTRTGRYKDERMWLIVDTFQLDRTTIYSWIKGNKVGRKRLYMLLQMVDLDVFRYLKENIGEWDGKFNLFGYANYG